MLFNVFIQMAEGDEYYHIPVMQDQSDPLQYYPGGLLERYPTGYTERTLGPAVAYGLTLRKTVQVRREPPHEEG